MGRNGAPKQAEKVAEGSVTPRSVPATLAVYPERKWYIAWSAVSRAMVRAALAGALDEVAFTLDPVFGVEVPAAVPGVPGGILTPRGTWADPAAYDAQAARLAQMFRENFEQYRAQVPGAVAAAGPTV